MQLTRSNYFAQYEIEDLDLNSFAPSWRDYWLNDLATDMKKSCCLTSLYPHLIPDSQESLSYTLPGADARRPLLLSSRSLLSCHRSCLQTEIRLRWVLT